MRDSPHPFGRGIEISWHPAFTDAIFDRQQPLLQEIRGQDDRLCAIILDQHDLLREFFGEWSWDSDAGEIRFENDEALEKFNALAVSLQEVAAEQDATQREFLSIQ